MTARHRVLFEAVADLGSAEDAWLQCVTRGLRAAVPHADAARGHLYEGPTPCSRLFGEESEDVLASFARSGSSVGTLTFGGASHVVVHGAAAPVGGALFVVDRRGEDALPPRSRWLLERFAEEVALALRLRHALARANDATLEDLSRAAGLTVWQDLMAGRRSVLGIGRVGPQRVLVVARCSAGGQGRLLSPVESRVARRAARGESNKAIAFALGLASSTVASHVRSVIRKLRLRSRLELVHLHGAVGGE